MRSPTLVLLTMTSIIWYLLCSSDKVENDEAVQVTVVSFTELHLCRRLKFSSMPIVESQLLVLSTDIYALLNKHLIQWTSTPFLVLVSFLNIFGITFPGPSKLTWKRQWSSKSLLVCYVKWTFLVYTVFKTFSYSLLKLFKSTVIFFSLDVWNVLIMFLSG